MSGLELLGLGVSPGRAAGPVARMPDPVPEPSDDRLLPESDRDREGGRLRAASVAVRERLEALAHLADGPTRDVLEATALMAADPSLVDAATERVLREGVPPERAVWLVADEVAASLTALGGYLAARARDVYDVRDRLVAELSGRAAPGVPIRSEPFVLVARDLAPADTATLDPVVCRAIVTEEGGPTSHTAILARDLGIPAVVGVRGALAIGEGVTVVVDAIAGTVRVGTTAPDRFFAPAGPGWVDGRADAEGRTADGRRVHLLANVADGGGARRAREWGAEGVGLFRTELCFLDRDVAPSIDEQVRAYRPVLDAFAGRRVVIRTLDAGADKALPFLPGHGEPNPALGVRGLRAGLRAPQVLDDQLEAIARAAQGTEADVWVMAPMVATAAEAADFAARCAAHGLRTPGVMVETPAAALCSEHVLAAVEFASIGTNDLTQYAMAADRQVGDLAELNDPWQPAVLRLVQITCSAGVHHGRPVGICGEAAADPALACVLVGLGATSLSMSPRALRAVGTLLAATSSGECARLADVAVAASGAKEARTRVLEALGLFGHLVG